MENNEFQIKFNTMPTKLQNLFTVMEPGERRVSGPAQCSQNCAEMA